MNVQSKIGKLLLALKYKGQIVKIDTNQVYSKEKDKVFTKYIVYTTKPKDGEIFWGKIELLKYLAGLYKELGGSNE